jgi:hypothetical protein
MHRGSQRIPPWHSVNLSGLTLWLLCFFQQILVFRKILKWQIVRRFTLLESLIRNFFVMLFR